MLQRMQFQFMASIPHPVVQPGPPVGAARSNAALAILLGEIDKLNGHRREIQTDGAIGLSLFLLIPGPWTIRHQVG
jgi:hypothetical protein